MFSVAETTQVSWDLNVAGELRQRCTRLVVINNDTAEVRCSLLQETAQGVPSGLPSCAIIPAAISQAQTASVLVHRQPCKSQRLHLRRHILLLIKRCSQKMRHLPAAAVCRS